MPLRVAATADLDPAPARLRYRALVMGMLVLVYTLNFVDRQVIAILALPIKAELGLNDGQLGLLGGLAFALFYTTFAIPIAALADRSNRVWIITVSLALWSAFTALCGTAASFAQLFLYRLGVGVGEAGGVAPSYALIADYFPLGQRARALSIFACGAPIGSAAGIFFGGWISTTIGWRAAFVILGVAGLLVAPLFRLLVREPVRGRLDMGSIRRAPPVRAVLVMLARKPSFWFLSLGASCNAMISYGLAFWLPSFFNRSLGMPLVEVSYLFGALMLIGGIVGLCAGGFLGDRYGRSDGRGYGFVASISSLAAAPLFAAALMSRSAGEAFVLFLLPLALSMMWLAPTVSAVQHLVPPAGRATATACFTFILNLIGLGFGSLLLGFISDSLSPRLGEESLRYAILCGLPLFVMAATLMSLGGRSLERDWFHDSADEAPAAHQDLSGAVR